MSSFDEAGVAVTSEDGVTVTSEDGEAEDRALHDLREDQAKLVMGLELKSSRQTTEVWTTT